MRRSDHALTRVMRAMRRALVGRLGLCLAVVCWQRTRRQDKCGRVAGVRDLCWACGAIAAVGVESKVR